MGREGWGSCHGYMRWPGSKSDLFITLYKLPSAPGVR